MRSRTLREGSLGLFVICGIGAFTLVGLWLRGFSATAKSYNFVAEFKHVAGIQSGATVRYRGVTVGRVVSILPGPNGVDMQIEIASSELLLPSGITVEVNQGGFIGETAVDILPSETPLDPNIKMNPRSNECDSRVIVCSGDRRVGQLGVSFDQLTRASLQFTRAFSDPVFVKELQLLLRNTSTATVEVSSLAKEIASLTEAFKGEVGGLSDSAIATTDSVGVAVDNVNGTVERVNRVIDNLNRLIEDNRTTVVSTLDQVSSLSAELTNSAAQLRPLLAQANTTLSSVDQTVQAFNQTDTLNNLDDLMNSAVVLSENAATASENLRDLSNQLNDPETLLQLERTLDSARTTFENVEKITSDLDDLTGDPQFRENLRRMVNGLSSLVSMTEQLDRQVQFARSVPPRDDRLVQTPTPSGDRDAL